MGKKGKGMQGESYAVPAKKLDKIQATEGAAKYDRVVMGGNKGDVSKTKSGKKDYDGSAKMGYSQKFGAGRMNGYAKGAAKVNNIMMDGPSQGFFDTVKKVGRTITRGAGDIGTQVLDMLQPDVQHIGSGGGPMANVGTGLGTSKQARRDAVKAKKIENDQYAKSRALAKGGQTYGTLADYFDDDGRGNAITSSNSGSRGR
tara:strand:+ start:1276 stop:1878 length:603 start_codon:yes stop_codon:yes gene_type:complete